MDLVIRNIRSRGELDGERIVFQAKSATDVGQYLILAARTNDSGSVVGGRIVRSYWIPDLEVRADDLIIVYTKSGSKSKKKNPSGTTSHFYYWGLDITMWEDERVKPVLMEISQWQAFSSAENEKVG